METIIHLLRDMVAIPSVNPAGPLMPGSACGEAAMCEYVQNFLRCIGVESERQPVMPERDNVFALIPGENAGKRILFEAHMDTVPADTWEGDPFDPVIKEGRLYGRGACDDKASLAAMLVALKRLTEQVGRPRNTIGFLAACNEERGFGVTGASVFCGLDIRMDMAVVGEPTSLDPVIAHKGCVRWRIKCLGKSVHSSLPEDGVNAIYRMAKVVARLEEYSRIGLGDKTHPLLGIPAFSVSLIEGGESVNIVPDVCTVAVDRRTLPGEAAADVMADVEQFLKAGAGLDFEPVFEEPFQVGGALETPGAAEIVQRACRAANKVTGRGRPKGVSYGSDAASLSKAGIECVVLGPGDIRQAHAVNEFVDLREVARAAEIYFEIMSSP